MRRPSRLRRIAKWGGVVACLITASGYLAHDLQLGWMDQTGCHFISLQSGLLRFSWADPSDATWGGPRGWFVQEWLTLWGRPRDWWPPVLYSGVNPKCVYVRLWFLFAMLAIPTCWLWRTDRRRPLRGHCKCGYDLTGNRSGVCPECGELVCRRA